MLTTIKNTYRFIKYILNVFYFEEYLLFGISLLLCGLLVYTNKSPQVTVIIPVGTIGLMAIRRGVFFFMENALYCLLLPLKPLKLVFKIILWISEKTWRLLLTKKFNFQIL